jgi:hypothetical protein
VHRSEELANLSTGLKSLFTMLRSGELNTILLLDPRPAQRVGGKNRRLSPTDIDQLVADHRGGAGSIYDLAEIYGVHRSTIALNLKERGMRLGRRPMEPAEIAKARELSERGFSLNAIGRSIGRDPKTIKAAL